MPEAHRQEQFVAEIVERLSREFAGAVPHGHVESTVRAARRDLEGQIVPEALEEMLHHLARYRLSRMTLADV
ncbi:three-helix bundle dimerization domain-containing protein [Amycolatopsis sp.]|uniref:three-helix bundle dimerization domain-containing protein n=1 Tax=Amycolatopsis sp. TaxID=37632 RepID=UPI002BE2EC43|nr:hypothetical protein [Amycolatopsis sp.]HVV12039.1 hypothetical protein [Amycolatopsis sp.]